MVKGPKSKKVPGRQSASDGAAALESNLGLIHKVLGTVQMPEAFREDAFQEAALAFLEHFNEYDPRRATLATFMWPHLRGAVTHFLRDEARFPATTDDDLRLDRSTTGTPRKSGKPLVTAADTRAIDIDVVRFVNSVEQVDRSLLFDLYWHDLSPSALARSMGVSRQSLHVRHKRLIAQGRVQLSPTSRAA